MISFILKCYPLFRVNFPYLKAAFHEMHINLNRIDFQYFNFKER